MDWLERLESRLERVLEGEPDGRHAIPIGQRLWPALRRAARGGYLPNRVLSPTHLADPVAAQLRQLLEERASEEGLQWAGPFHVRSGPGWGVAFGHPDQPATARALVAVTGGLTGPRAALFTPPELTLGRDPGCGLRLGGPTVSRLQLRILGDPELQLQVCGRSPVHLEGRPVTGCCSLRLPAHLEVAGTTLIVYPT